MKNSNHLAITLINTEFTRRKFDMASQSQSTPPRTAVREITAPSPIKEALPNSPSGLVCFFQKNARNAYVVTSTHNYIHFENPAIETESYGIRIRDAKLDIGATKSLFYFQSTADMIAYIRSVPTLENNPANGILYHIKSSDSPGGKVITIKLSRVNGFSIRLANDIIQPQIPICVPYVQYHLCTEDIDGLLTLGEGFVPSAVMESLAIYKASLNEIIPRRKWARVGNDIIDQFALFKPREVAFMCDMKSFQLPSWPDLVALELQVIGRDYLLLPNVENGELHEIADELVSSQEVNYGRFY